VNFLRRFALQKKEILNGSSRLDVFEIARVPDMLSSFFPSWSGKGLISTPVFVCVVMRVTLVAALCAPFREYYPPAYQVVRSSKFIYDYYCNRQAPFYTGERSSRVVKDKEF